MTVFRGATAERRSGMSWTTDIGRANQFRQRHSWHAPTAIYRTVAAPDAVLALLERRGEGPPEVVVDPADAHWRGTGRTASPAALPPRRMTPMPRVICHNWWT